MYLGIEIGGTKLQLAIGRGDGVLVAVRRFDVDRQAGAAGILQQIVNAAAEWQHDAQRLTGGIVDPSTNPIRAVGIGFGGPVDAAHGIVTTSNHVEGWTSFPLAAWVRNTLGVSAVAIENDADTAALGEARHGAGRGLSPILYLTIGSGIGGGLIVEGAIYRGAGAGAVEIGHLRIGESTLEGLASGWSIGRQAREALDGIPPGSPDPSRLAGLVVDGDSRAITAQAVAQAAQSGDQLALEVLDRATTAMAEGLGHAVTLLAPRRIILGGGVSLIGEALWFEPIRHKLKQRVFPPFRDQYDLVPAALGEQVVLHGALALAADLA